MLGYTSRSDAELDENSARIAHTVSEPGFQQTHRGPVQSQAKDGGHPALLPRHLHGLQTGHEDAEQSHRASEDRGAHHAEGRALLLWQGALPLLPLRSFRGRA
jgi:hypothetical protein